ncbi:hypothetical protein FA13DRAFT_1715448 [Coprinellus micaceus]|uniref:Uncharacterized protein n=1 Tax=Coprinellus micaceus TaxID=71717 RepID=A0A4Y7SQ71_COPMI|nr:hypothetical protein FA13DRAFT_1715448 [Coprinellus micaceus]
MSENQATEACFGRCPLKFVSLPVVAVQTVLNLPSQNNPPPFDPDHVRGPCIEKDDRTYTHAQAVAVANSFAAVQHILDGIAAPDNVNLVLSTQERDLLRELLNIFVPLLSGVHGGGAWGYGLQNALRDALVNVQNHLPSPGWMQIMHDIEHAGDLFDFLGMLQLCDSVEYPHSERVVS